MLDRKAQQPAFILSAARAEHTDEVNERAYRSLEDALVEADIAYKPVLGCYEGVEEKSVVICTSQAKALGIAALFGQESILFLDRQRNAVLIFVELPQGQANNRTEHVGKFEECTEVEAKAEKAWTYDRLQDTWFRVVPYVAPKDHTNPDVPAPLSTDPASDRLHRASQPITHI